MNCRSKSRISSATSRPRAPPSAWTRRCDETQFDAHKDGRIDFTRNQAMLDNVRLWDWSAFHDTLSQSQPLRPYTYADTDVDRYIIDGKLRQTLLAPRELDLNQLGEAQNSWINANIRLHARLRTGAGGSQPHHAHRTCPSC